VAITSTPEKTAGQFDRSGDDVLQKIRTTDPMIIAQSNKL